MVTRSIETDYLVVGAGAMGMAFTDALIDHADVHVTLVDRRHAAGGHWLDAYPFVQLHQASVFYGVASTVLGHGAVQTTGPEAGLQERARQSEIRAYYDDILHRRFVGSGRVTFLGGSEYHADGSSHLVTSRVSGETAQVDVRRRVVDATYLSPTIPATTPPPFGVADDVRVVAVNELARLAAAPQQLRDRRFRQDRDRRDRVAVGERRASRTASSGCARAIRGCSTAPSSSPTRWWRSGSPRTRWRRPPTPSRSTTSSCASRPPA